MNPNSINHIIIVSLLISIALAIVNYVLSYTVKHLTIDDNTYDHHAIEYPWGLDLILFSIMIIFSLYLSFRVDNSEVNRIWINNHKDIWLIAVIGVIIVFYLAIVVRRKGRKKDCPIKLNITGRLIPMLVGNSFFILVNFMLLNINC
jgi:hypothetical protein